MLPFAHNKIVSVNTQGDLNLDRAFLMTESLSQSYSIICGGVLSVSLLRMFALHK